MSSYSAYSGRSLSHRHVKNSNSNLRAKGFQNMLAPQKTLKSPRTSTQQKEKKPRIVINKMILNNFKSYFGEQEIGPFHKV
jgi:hypothetical protein